MSKETEHGSPREEEVLAARRQSLERIRKAGKEPFALTFDPDTTAAQLVAEFPEGRLAPGAESGRRAKVAGPHSRNLTGAARCRSLVIA